MATAEELDAIDDEDEDEYIEASSQLDVIGLVEEELLLNLPFAPRHPDGACSSVSEGLKALNQPFCGVGWIKEVAFIGFSEE